MVAPIPGVSIGWGVAGSVESYRSEGDVIDNPAESVVGVEVECEEEEVEECWRSAWLPSESARLRKSVVCRATDHLTAQCK